MTRLDALSARFSEPHSDTSGLVDAIVSFGVGNIFPTLSRNDQRRIVNAFSHRMASVIYDFPNGVPTEPQQKALIYQMVATEVREFALPDEHDVPMMYRGLSPDQQERVREGVLQLVSGHEYLLQHRKEYWIGNGISIYIDYIPSRWEGIGEIRIAMKDTITAQRAKENPIEDPSPYPLPEGYEPLYVVRGNPYAVPDRLCFDIRAIQAWAEDMYPGVIELENNFIYQLRRERRLGKDVGIPDSDLEIQRFDSEIKGRNAAFGRLERAMKGEAISPGEAMKIKMEDIVLLFASEFLRSVGVHTIRGVAHAHQGEDIQAVGLTPPFNYDKLFRRWFYQVHGDVDTIFPYFVSPGAPERDYFRNQLHMPSSLRYAMNTIARG